MKYLNPVDDLGTLIFDKLGEVRFDSATINDHHEIVVTSDFLALYIEEYFVNCPVKSMTLCEEDYKWSLCAELEVPASTDYNDRLCEDDEYYFFRSHNWETNMKLSKLLYPDDRILKQIESGGPGWTLILPNASGDPYPLYGVGYKPYIMNDGHLFCEENLLDPDFFRVSLNLSREQLHAIAQLAGCESDWPAEVLLLKNPVSGRGYLRIEFITTEFLTGATLTPKFVTMDILDIILENPAYNLRRCSYALRWCVGSECSNTAKEFCRGFQAIRDFKSGVLYE